MKNIKHLIIASVTGILLSFTIGCTPDMEEFDRPASLAGPIYQQLESQGNCSLYLQCLDRTEYAVSLSTGGLWTVFVPNDSAFNTYLDEKGYSSVQDIPLNIASDIIKTSIIVDAYNTTLLTYFKNNWYEGNSFRKLSQYMDTFDIVDGTEFSNFGASSDQYRNVDTTRKYLIQGGGRQKPITYFVDKYIDGFRQPMERTDYSYMFPGEEDPLEGEMKVGAAHVTEIEIPAENGIIYVLDKVLEPAEMLYANLSSPEYGGKYSTFKKMIDRFGYLKYQGLEENPFSNSKDSTYSIAFHTDIASNLLAFNPNDEIYPKLASNTDRTEADALGLLVPTNKALSDYLLADNEVAKNFTSYDEMPLDVVAIFLNVNFFANYAAICPSKFSETYNVGLETVNMSEADVVDTKFCSNGLFVGVNKIYPTATFSTVYGPMVLDTSYTIMLKCIKDLGLDNNLKGSGVEYSIFGLRNDQFVGIKDPNNPARTISVVVPPLSKVNYGENVDYVYLWVEDASDPQLTGYYPDPYADTKNATEVDYVQETLNDIVMNQMIDSRVDGEDNFYLTKKGDYVYISDNATKAQGSGDYYNETSFAVTDHTDLSNGVVYESEQFLNPATKYTYRALKDAGTFTSLLWILKWAGLEPETYVPGTDDKLIPYFNLDKSYTFFAPNDAAIAKAVADSVIMDYMKYFVENDAELKAQAVLDYQTFIKKHIIQDPIVTDGHTSGIYKSLYKIGVVDLVNVYTSFDIVNNDKESLIIRNVETADTMAITTPGGVNILSKRVVVHEIDNYLY